LGWWIFIFFAKFGKDEATSSDLDISLFTVNQNSQANWTLSWNLIGIVSELDYVSIKTAVK